MSDECIELYRGKINDSTITVTHMLRAGSLESGTIHLSVLGKEEKGYLWGFTELITTCSIEDHLIRLLGLDSSVDSLEIHQIAVKIEDCITKEKDSRKSS